MAKPKYLQKQSLKEMAVFAGKILELRETVFVKTGVDLLDTDALSAVSIYQVVSQYDTDYNVNFSRNGEDAISQGVKIEQKASRVDDSLTKKGQKRKGAECNGVYMFHANGDLTHGRYIFVSRRRQDLKILRLYDISGKKNCDVIFNKLHTESMAWTKRTEGDKKKQKNDIITISESFILDNVTLTSTIVDGVKVFRDTK